MSEPYEVPMFEVPKPYRRPKAPKKAESWRVYHGRKRLTCDLCILDAHAGTVFVPIAPAHHVYTTRYRVWNLCATHGAQIKTGERTLPRMREETDG